MWKRESVMRYQRVLQIESGTYIRQKTGFTSISKRSSMLLGSISYVVEM